MPDRIDPGGPRRLPKRKRIRLAREVYADSGEAFLITICTARRRRLFADPKSGHAVFQALVQGKLFTGAKCHAACSCPITFTC